MSARNPAGLSQADRLALLPEAERRAFFASLSAKELAELQYRWEFWSRPSQRLPPGKWINWLILAGRGAGKMLDDETPIPTPSGWTTMGALDVGDHVFDEAGRACRVEAKFQPFNPDQYRVNFSDGSSVNACGDHQWVTWTHRDRKQYLRHGQKIDFPAEWPRWRGDLLDCHGNVVGRYGPEIRTTKQIADTLTYSTRDDLNHCIPVAGALQLPEAELPCDPWLLGYWLGNGSVGRPELTSGGYRGDFDADFLAAKLTELQLQFSRRDYPETTQSKFRVLARGLVAPSEKRVAPIYLRASIGQRTALLRGLMDSDGYCEDSKVEFTSMSEGLARDVLELARSLSERPVLSSGRATLYGADLGEKWRVTWRPSFLNPFSLARKAVKVSPASAQGLRLRHRMIVAVERIAPRPMSCITVDGPSSMYLAGEAMIPTHNTRTGAETVRQWIKTNRYVNLIGATSDDVREIMIEGESGILACCPDAERPRYIANQRKLKWPNGATSLLFSAEEPDRLRGKQHMKLWMDELAAWRHPDAYDQAALGLRLGANPQALITTTPRPTKLIKSLVASKTTIVTRGSTYDNASHLADAFINQIVEKYQGTRLGRQELEAEILDDVPGALWTRDMLDRAYVKAVPASVNLRRVVVALDPSVTSGEDSDEFGMIVVGLGSDGHGYVLEDGTGRWPVMDTKGDDGKTIAGWPKKAIQLYRKWKADRIVAEVNNGGDMIEATLRMVDASVSYSAVHASRGKVVRAEPAAALYEKEPCLVHHVGAFPALEDEMTAFTHDFDRSKRKSPNRVDALVWGLTELKIDPSGSTGMFDHYREMAERAKAGKSEPVAQSAIAEISPMRVGGGGQVVKEPELVKLIVPRANVGGVICGISRREYVPDSLGMIEVLPEDAPPLKRAGFVGVSITS